MSEETTRSRFGCLPRGTFVIGNALYAKCANCGSIIRLNKPIFGSLHFCSESVPEAQQSATDTPRKQENE